MNIPHPRITILALVFAAAALCGGVTDAVAGDDAVIAEGERLAHVLDCTICHTPKMMTDMGPVPDPERWFMGHPSDEEPGKLDAESLMAAGWLGAFNGHFTAWAGPWGVSYAINLTPDEETGLGTWTEEMFVKALRTGKHMGEGRPILPPMPWPAYARLTDEELHAIFVYLQSLKPIRNAVPEAVINMPPDGR